MRDLATLDHDLTYLLMELNHYYDVTFMERSFILNLFLHLLEKEDDSNNYQRHHRPFTYRLSLTSSSNYTPSASLSVVNESLLLLRSHSSVASRYRSDL
jgi:hypothetical protein